MNTPLSVCLSVACSRKRACSVHETPPTPALQAFEHLFLSARLKLPVIFGWPVALEAVLT